MRGMNGQRILTQWAAQFGVAGELCKRGYHVGFTMGANTPLADLFVMAPDGQTTFLIDVKGQRRCSFWRIQPKASRTDLFYVLAHVPKGKSNRYFVLRQSEINKLCKDYKHSGVKFDPRFAGFNWASPYPFEDKWDNLPGYAPL